MLLVASPASVSAQNVDVAPISVGDVQVPPGTFYINADDCANGATVVFRLSNVPTDRPTIDIYRGTSGSGCETETRVNQDTGTTCIFLATRSTNNASMFDLEVTASDLMCNEGANEKPTLYFLPVNATMSADAVGQNYGIVEVEIDADPPAAPTGVSGGNGESSIPVSWNTSAGMLDGFAVYIDSSGGAGVDGGTCGSDVLIPGESVDSVPGSVRRKSIGEGSASSTTLSASDIDGDSAAVAVVAVDLAGNESVLSEVACVSVIPTDGFWDVYEQEDGAVDAGCPCAAMGPVHAETAWPVGLSVLALTLRRRRERRCVRGRDRRRP
ncbi:MAG: hypothetical protein PVI30_13715 [Myxococcales bacterium]